MHRAQAREQTRRRLLEAALAILEEDGEPALTTTAITRRAGISQSGFYNYFADMEDMLCHLIEDVERQRRSAAASARRAARDRDGDVVEAMRESFRETVTRTAAHPNLFRLLLRSRLDPASRVGAEARRQLDTTRANFLRGLAAGRLPMATEREQRMAGLIADGLIATTEGLLIGHLDGRHPDIEEILDALVLFALGVPSAARRRRPVEAP